MLVLTADIGEGHDLPARIIKADLEEEVPGAEVEIENGLEAMGRISAAVLRNGSKVIFRWMPWMFDIQYWLITRFAPTRWLFHHLGYWLSGRGLLRAIEDHDPDVVVSTYPGVTAVLGMLRENRRLGVPVHRRSPTSPGCATGRIPGWTSTTSPIRSRSRKSRGWSGRARVEWVRPPISREFLMPRTRRDAREALGVPAHARMVLVSGGGWGIGDLEGAINTALSDGDTLVVCITGRNEAAREKLEQRFGDNEQVRVLGFTEQMSDWMAAADAMIHATAGLTVLEAHIRGCPVVSYGFSAGHLRANNAAFERFGLAEVARSEHELESVLRHVTSERRSPDSSFASLPSIASRVLTARPRVRPQPVWRAALRARRHRGQPGGRRRRDDARRHPPRDALPGDRRSRSRAGSTSARTKTRRLRHPPAARRRRRSSARPPSTPQPLDRPPARRRASAPRASSTRARRWRRSCRAWARRSGSSCASRGRTAWRSPSTTARTRRARRSCSRSCARRAPRRPSSSSASRSCGGPALAAEIVAAGHRVELHCHRHRNQLRLTPGAAARRRRARRGRRSRRRPGRPIPTTGRPTGSSAPAACGRSGGAAGDRSYGRCWGRDWTRRATARSIADRATSGAVAGDILLLHDADYYSARGSWVEPRRRCRPSSRSSSGQGLKAVSLAAEAAAPGSTGRNRRTLRRAVSPSRCAAGPGRRSPWA